MSFAIPGSPFSHGLPGNKPGSGAGITAAPRFVDERLLRGAIGAGDEWRCRYRELVDADEQVLAPEDLRKLGA